MTRTAFITGILGGIGSATALAFRDAGWKVAGVDRSLPTGEVPGGAAFLNADVADAGASSRLEEFLAALDGLDAVVNNAAIQVEAPLLEMNPADWDATMATNVRSAFVVSRITYGLLRQTRGAIVNVASVHAAATSPGLAAYASSKGALVALTRATALEFGPAGIRVNAVLPGAVDTPMLRAGLARWPRPEEALVELRRRTPLGRIAEPREIAEAVVFLADGERSSFITGQTLVADGGVLARLSSE